MAERTEVPSCTGGCTAFEDNPQEYVETVICPACPHGRELEYPEIMSKLMHYTGLVDSGCPVDRHELTDDEWILIGAFRAERTRMEQERAKSRARDHGDYGRRTA